MREGDTALIIGLALAIGSAAAINLGFLLQHRGLAEVTPHRRGAIALFRASFSSRRWLAGQTVGVGGFAVQVAAVAIAPLSLVQAFAAGGLALSLPLASRLFDHRVRRSEALAVLAMAVALSTLPLGLPDTRERLDETTLWLSMLPILIAAAGLAWRAPPALAAVGAGLSYGVADAAVKAISVRWSGDGAAVLISSWLPLFIIGTFVGFLCLQRALRDSGAVTSISLMTAFATLVSLGAGLSAFGESLGGHPPTIALHAIAIGVVLVCVHPLAAAQVSIETRAPSRSADRHGAQSAAEGE